MYLCDHFREQFMMKKKAAPSASSKTDDPQSHKKGASRSYGNKPGGFEGKRGAAHPSRGAGGAEKGGLNRQRPEGGKREEREKGGDSQARPGRFDKTRPERTERPQSERPGSPS